MMEDNEMYESDSPNHSPLVGDCSSAPTRQRSMENLNGLPDGQKLVIFYDLWRVPEWPAEAVTRLSSAASLYAKRDIPIIYEDFTKVPSETYDKIIDLLEEEFECGNSDQGLHCSTLRKIINDAWKRKKSKLKIKYVDGFDPATVKAGPAPKSIPIEDWRVFVDMCNSEKKKVISAKDKINRGLQTAPNCSGRTSTAVVRRKLATKLGVEPSEVPRSSVYIELHTKKNKVPQQPELFNQINAEMSSNPKSRKTSTTDALAKFLPDKKCMRAMGPAICKNLFKKMTPILGHHEFERKRNDDWKKDISADMAELKSMVANIVTQQAPTNTTRSPAALIATSSESETFMDLSVLNSHVVLRGGWPPKNCATGVIKSVDPTHKVGNRVLGARNYLVFVNVVLDGTAELPEPHDEWTITLDQLGQGYVIWPKGLVEVAPSA